MMPYRDLRLGGIERWSLEKPADWDVRVPDALLDCVVFLVENADGRPHYGGTAFFMSVHSEIHSDTRYRYLITARHNLYDKYGNRRDLSARINVQGGGWRMVPLRDVEWEESIAADVAVYWWPLDTEMHLDYKVISD